MAIEFLTQLDPVPQINSDALYIISQLLGLNPTSYRTDNNQISAALKNIINLPILSGASDPSTSTVGEIGQLYINTTNNTTFVCTSDVVVAPFIWSTNINSVTANDNSISISGNNFPDIKINVLSGSNYPNGSTVGTLGQIYINTSTNNYFVCVKDSFPYIWVSNNNGLMQIVGSHVANFIGSVPSTPVTIEYVKTGKSVTLQVTTGFQTISTSTDYIYLDTPLPAFLYSGSDFLDVSNVIYNGSDDMGNVTVLSSGDVTFFSPALDQKFTSGQTNGVPQQTISYISLN